jgi:riboflavin kinase / FMN adenylyltransferase
MKVHDGLEDHVDIQRSVVTTGTFDGVHIGHQVIIRRINELAKEVEGESVLMTFHPHPRKVLYPDTLGKEIKMINTQREKIAMLETTGLDHLVIMPFTIAFAHTPSDVFIREILHHKLNIRKSVVGFNHFFGFNKEGNHDQLVSMGRELGFDVEEIPEQDIQNETVSSTKIRKAIEEGNIQRANAYLNHIYLLMGMLQRTPFATPGIEGLNTYLIHAEEQEKILPPEGIYAVRIKQDRANIKAIALKHDHLTPADALLILPLEGQQGDCTGDTTLHFYKQLTGRFSMREGNLPTFLPGIISEAEELIY